MTKLRLLTVFLLAAVLMSLPGLSATSSKGIRTIKDPYYDRIPEEYQERYKKAEYRIIVIFSIKDCMSCLFILGKINDEIILKRDDFFAVGVMAENNDYSAEKLRKDSNLAYPIITSGIEDTRGTVFDTIPTPYIIMMNKKNHISQIIGIPFDGTDKPQKKVIDFILKKEFSYKPPE